MEQLQAEGFCIFRNILTLEECAYHMASIDNLFANTVYMDGAEIEKYERLRTRNPGLSDLILSRLDRHIDSSSRRPELIIS